MENNKIYGLDLLRGIAGYGVAITHYLFFAQKINDFEYYSFIFVEIFFVLSGFVLSSQLIKIYKNNNNVKVFYIRRLFRTIPLYLVALVFYTAITDNFNIDFFKFLFFIQKAIPDFVISDYFLIAWSLSIEEFFYLLFPLYLILFNKINISKLIIYFIFFFIIIKLFFYDKVSSDFLRTGTFMRLDSIALGFLLSIYINKLINFKRLILVSALLLLLLIVSFKTVVFENSNIYTLYFIFLSQIFGLVSILFFINLEFFIRSNILKKICNIFANQTYSIYLFHFIVMHFLIMSNNNLINNLLVYIFLLYFISIIVFKYFEQPILRLRPKYKNA